jgi:alpha-galactosidase
VGDLPLGCAAVCNASVSVQRLAVEAAVTGDDYLLRQAMMMDPLTGAVLNPPEIAQMTDELLVAQARWLPQYKKAVRAAKKRLSSGDLLPTRGDYAGAARLHTKTVKEMARDRAAATRQAAEADKARQEAKRSGRRKGE